MTKPLTSIAILAFAFSAFAQTTTQAQTQGAATAATTVQVQTPVIKIKSKGEDLRTVIDTIFEQSGKQYVLETNFHQSLYMNLDGISFQKAVDIISNVADLEFEEKQGIWYIHKKLVGTGKPFVKTVAKDDLTTPKPLLTATKTRSTKTPAKPAAKTTTKMVTAANTAGESFAALSTPSISKPLTLDLSKRLTVQLKKMDIRDVFAEFGTQGKVTIEVDDTVPNYKLDAFFYNTSVKFALDKVCKTAGLKYVITPGKTVRVSKA